METFDTDKLVKYEMTNNIVMVGFPNFETAEQYANQNNGELVEVGFKDGNDNPTITNTHSLVKKKAHFFVEAGPEYKFIHSSDAEFQDYAADLQKLDAKLDGVSSVEKYISNGKIQIAEDPIIVLKNYEFESVTSRERAKYLKQAKVYQIGVSLPLES
ncbi:MAG: hypothetical protein ACOH1N_13695 [Lutibacter sp.]